LTLAAALLALTGALAASITASVTIGPVKIEPLNVWRIVGHHTVPATPATVALRPDIADIPLAQQNIIWLIRMPRVLLAAVIGSALAVVGVAMQAMVRNPIAEPYILGVSSGASVGAVLVILWGWFKFWGHNALSFAAFIGGLVSFVLVFVLSQKGGRITPLRLILVGIAVSQVCGAITSFVTFRARNQEGIQNALFWLAGSVAGARWEHLRLPALALLIGVVILLFQARAMNALVAGEETAVTLGINTHAFRALLMVVSALLVGTMVAVAGSIGFVGLIMPHVIRIVFGSDHRRVLPLAALCGAIFLIWVDVGARMVAAPQELPVGVITSAIGGPFFLWMLRFRSRQLEGSGR
jgi:iron complex transport system permease protein